MVINSLYECKVMHCRLKPKRHSFNYRVFMFCVDLDELPSLGKKLIGFSHNFFNLFSINDADHIDIGKEGGIRANLMEWLAQQGVDCPDDSKIKLITFPRVLGYGFNPVSFYYVNQSSGEPIIAVVEVVNTFREMKLYAIKNQDSTGLWSIRVAKNFYVSPFSDPGMDFDFKISNPSEKWRVNIDDYDKNEKMLISSVRGEQRDLTSARLFWYMFKYPLLSFKIISLIHWHALILWILRVPFVRKADRRELQIDVMKPHSSLKKNST